MQWLIDHPETIWQYHKLNRSFIAVHPSHGVLFSAPDEETFDAMLADRRPSVLSQMFMTCTALWITKCGGVL